VIDLPVKDTKMRDPPIVCVIGKKKSGKTTTVVGLVRELASRGYRVMTAKHGHHFEVDTAGTDSYRHRREAGAARVVLAGPSKSL
jgi:molybdopterin-guanine dinucleotide biosynthesis protein B